MPKTRTTAPPNTPGVRATFDDAAPPVEGEGEPAGGFWSDKHPIAPVVGDDTAPLALGRIATGWVADGESLPVAPAAMSVQQVPAIPVPPSVWHRDWFRPSIMPPRPDYVPALAVLLVAAELADEHGSVPQSALWSACNRSVCEGSLPLLRAQGWIAYDGVTIKVMRIPERAS